MVLYKQFEARYSRQPNVRDLIGIFLSLELYPDPDVSLAPADLLAATASNVYYGTCIENSLGIPPCDGYDIINLLQTSDEWVQMGGEDVNQDRMDELF